MSTHEHVPLPESPEQQYLPLFLSAPDTPVSHISEETNEEEEENEMAEYDASAFLPNISTPGTFTRDEVGATWDRIRAVIDGTGRTVPAAIDDASVIPFITFFIVNSASSRQPSGRRINVGGFNITVGDVLFGCGHRLRQFLRYYSSTAESILKATPALAARQASAYGLFNEQAQYAFDFVDLSRVTMGNAELKRLKAAIDEKIAAEPVDDVPADISAALSAPSVRQSITRRNVGGSAAPQS